VAWVIYDADEAAGYLFACFGYSLEYAGRDAFIEPGLYGYNRHKGWISLEAQD